MGLPLAERLINTEGFSTPRPTETGHESAGWAGGTAEASATPHQPGDYVDVITSLDVDAYGLHVTHSTTVNIATADSATLVDLAVGAEFIIAENLNFGGAVIGREYFIPVFVPAGTPVSCRARSITASKQINVRACPAERRPGLPLSDRVVAMGVDLANSRGTVLPAPGGTTSEGAWQEVEASTDEAFRGLIIGLGQGGDTVFASTHGQLDIGIGASGQEVELIRNVGFTTTTSEGIITHCTGPYPCSIPRGSRLSARWSIGDLSNGALDVILHGVR